MTPGPLNCTLSYVSGHREGLPCPYRATAIVNTGIEPPFLACGYHARAFTDNAVYPLDWSLATIRRWQRHNLDTLLDTEAEGHRQAAKDVEAIEDAERVRITREVKGLVQHWSTDVDDNLPTGENALVLRLAVLDIVNPEAKT